MCDIPRFLIEIETLLHLFDDRVANHFGLVLLEEATVVNLYYAMSPSTCLRLGKTLDDLLTI